jgi:hypothetical protein
VDQGGEPIQGSGAALKRGAIGAAILVIVIIAGLLLLSRTRNNADVTLDSSSSRSTTANPAGHGGTNKDGSSIGGAIPGADPSSPDGTGPRSLITLDGSTTTSTAASTPTTKVTVAPTVVTPTNPPPTNPPPTNAPPTTAPPTTSPTVAFQNFPIPRSVDCSDNGFHEVTLTWDTVNATKVTVAIDGTGEYKHYTGSEAVHHTENFPFSCPGPHRYLVTAEGPGGPAVKDITITKA